MASTISSDLHVVISDENLLRLGLMTRKVGLKYAKQIIFKYFPKDPIPLYNALASCKKNLRNLFPDQHQILFGTPSSGTNIDSCDLSLLGKILKLKNDPSSNTIEDLLKSRNWIAHYGSVPLTDPLYTQKFNDIKAILKKLGANDAEIEHFRYARIDNSGKIIEDLLKDMKNEIPRSIVLREALDIVCIDIGEGWRDLAISLHIEAHVVDGIAQENITNEEKMNKCFECKSFNISWNHLRQQLIMQNYLNIVKKIVEDTCITTELKDLRSTQISHYLSRFEYVQSTDILSKWPLTSTTRTSQYVNLYISNDIGRTDNTVNSDRIFNLTNQFNLREKIKMEEILKDDSDDFVTIRGIAGIGKSTLADILVLKWSRGEMLHDIKLLFYIKCREIEETHDETLKDFTISHFSDFYQEMNLDHMEEFGKHVLFVFDGFDEIESSKVTKIYDMLGKNYFKASHSFRVCITGRPNAIQNLVLKIKHRTPKLIDVMGFTTENQRSFIEKHYSDRKDKEEFVNRMMEEIERNPEVKSLATIPLYLETLCYINDQQSGFDHVTSSVSANLVVSLFIIQSCYKDLSLSNMNLYQVACDKMVVQMMLELGRLAFCSLENHQPVFTDSTSNVEKCGILVKYGSTKSGFSYQFQHLIFSEFFCGLYLFCRARNEIYDIFMNLKFESPLWNALPTLVALYTSMSHRNSNNDIVHIFLKEVEKETRREYLLDRHIDCLLVKLFNCQLGREVANFYYHLRWNGTFNWLRKFLEKPLKSYFLLIDESWWTLIASICESRRNVPLPLVDTINQAKRLTILITSNEMLHYVARLFSPKHDLLSYHTSILLIIDFTGFLSDEELESVKILLSRSYITTIRPKFNAERFISLVTDEKKDVHKGFVKLRSLILSYLPEELIEFLPYLHHFGLTQCESIPDESAQMLSLSLYEVKNKGTVLLGSLYIDNCSDQVVKNMLPCTTYITDLVIMDCCISLPTLTLLSKTIKDAEWTLHRICLGCCNITNDGVIAMSECFSNIEDLNLCNNPDISEVGMQAIADSILKQVEANGMATLKVLHLSHLNSNLFEVLLPAVPCLSKLILSQSSKIDVKVMEMLRDKIGNRETELELIFDKDVFVDNASVKKIFDGFSVTVEFL